jgi:hypothetical protein
VDKESAWRTVLSHVSYVTVWVDAVEGHLIPKYLVFHLSAAVFWLFLSIKVLEARKWS